MKEEKQPPKEKKDMLEKKGEVSPSLEKSEVNHPLEKAPNKYEKQVAKLIRQNVDVLVSSLSQS